MSRQDQRALLVSLGDGRASFFDGPETASDVYAFALSTDGAEVLCATLQPPALHRYELADSE
jgi:hypothetical protein